MLQRCRQLIALMTGRKANESRSAADSGHDGRLENQTEKGLGDRFNLWRDKRIMRRSRELLQRNNEDDGNDKIKFILTGSISGINKNRSGCRRSCLLLDVREM